MVYYSSKLFLKNLHFPLRPVRADIILTSASSPSLFTASHLRKYSSQICNPDYSVMSHLSYIVPPGQGETLRKKFWFSQAVRIGDRIEISGQSKNLSHLVRSSVLFGSGTDRKHKNQGQ